jgi:hypothetical protein
MTKTLSTSTKIAAICFIHSPTKSLGTNEPLSVQLREARKNRLPRNSFVSEAV